MAKFCPQCGNPLKDNPVFCPKCGTRLVKEETASQPQQPVYIQQPPKKKSGLVIALAGIVLIAVFGITAFVSPGFLLNREDPHDKKAALDSTSRGSEKETAKLTEDETALESAAVPVANASASEAAPKAVTDPALTGTWRFHNQVSDVDIVWTFREDGTGNLYSNGYDIPIVSYVATKIPFTQYKEDGFLLTVYWGEMVENIGNAVYTTILDPIEYGYEIRGNTLRITYSRDIANDYVDFTRE